ncbi:unnamed protein product [Phyllotreta striolata]|uniref:Origin recognition complex subunit 1 n=1 Tax=Phyllotreta striolata TaxID=444603 RepID=A0A9N9XP10_PHYSR|nr:unnamed protein product [Phyllotreta striolata]
MNIFNEKKQYQEYSQVFINNVIYKTNEAVVIENQGEKYVGIICKIIDNNNNETQLCVRKYIFAKKLKKLFNQQGQDYDEANEVVQDLSCYYIVNISNIISKCVVAFLSMEDSIYYVLSNNLNPSVYYSCRFALKGSQLFPVEKTIIKEIYFEEKTTISNENTPITSSICRIEMQFDDEKASPPTRRNSVKRDLNKSFGYSSPTNQKSILNYSIISSSDEENDLKLKLRVSKRDNQTSKSKDTCTTPPKYRRSARDVPRKSYVDYISPKKRQHGRKSESDGCDFKDPQESTPKKQPRKEISRRSQRIIKTPQRYVDDTTSTQRKTPVRRSLRLLSEDLQLAQNKENEVDRDNRPAKESDCLDDSLRKNIFKTNLKSTISNEDKNILNDSNCGTHNGTKLNGDDNRIMNINSELKVQLSKLNLSTSTETSSDDSSESDVTDRESKPKSKRKSTPKKIKIANDSQKVPKTPRQVSIESTRSPRTPKNRARLIREGVITPSMQERSTKVEENKTPLMRAKSQLHLSYIVDSLPCREKEYSDVQNFIEGKLLDGCGGCMYISGVPGTGKTATVTSVIKSLQKNKKIPRFDFISINGMALSEPRQSYVEILKQLRGKTHSWEQAQNILEDIFVKQKKIPPIVMLIDELDILCTKRQDVVYNLLDWPTKAKNQLIVITIANTMDLPERLLMSRVTSRLGLTRLTFQAYTYKQLQEIVSKRLCGTDTFNSDAIQFVARKVASVSGDARRALDICRRAVEIAETSGSEQMVNISHVDQALNAMITQPKILAIMSCSKLEKLILQSIVAEVERTGVEETTFCDVYKMLITCSSIEGFKITSPTVAQRSVARLSAYKLILTDQKCNNINQKIILNVSIDDVFYALNKN